MGTLKLWFSKLVRGQPHFRIGGVADPYMLRWFLIPRNAIRNLYLHKFLRDDDDRALHDHPWPFWSFMFWGTYTETTEQGVFVRHAPSLVHRKAEHRHRVTLARDENGNPITCWTIVLTGPRMREWGFWCPKGFVHWKDFTAHDDEGNIGKGCGE